MGRPEQGQVVPLVALVMVAVGVMLYGVAVLGRSAIDRAQAQSAADAAALAGAAAGDGAARQVASANGAAVVSIERFGPDVRVVVRVGHNRRSARARRLSRPM